MPRLFDSVRQCASLLTLGEGVARAIYVKPEDVFEGRSLHPYTAASSGMAILTDRGRPDRDSSVKHPLR